MPKFSDTQKIGTPSKNIYLHDTKNWDVSKISSKIGIFCSKEL